jgi:hypothetical protein
MKAIRKKCNTGCYSPPPLKKYHPEIYERRGAQKNDEECLNVEKRTEYKENWKRGILPGFPYNFSF